MDDDQTDVKQEAGAEASATESSTEETQAASEESTATDTSEQEESHIDTTDQSTKKGASQRIREVTADKNREKERADSLQAKLAELTGSVEPQVPQTPYTPQVESGAELTPEQYKQDVLKTAESLVTLKVKQSEAINRINNEAQEAIRKYPQLDPDSDQFDIELSESITEATQAYVKSSPYTASPLKFVDKMMKPYQRSVSREVGKASENIARQVSQAAVRPTSVSVKTEKTYQDKSIKELEAELGVIN